MSRLINEIGEAEEKKRTKRREKQKRTEKIDKQRKRESVCVWMGGCEQNAK